MGTWDYAPWDNDGAADWFGELMETTGIVARVEETLEGDPEQLDQEIRAAASVLLFLGRTYIWPVDTLDPYLKLAIAKLERIAELEQYAESEELSTAIQQEIALLRSRLDGTPPPDDEAAVEWWLNLR